MRSSNRLTATRSIPRYRIYLLAGYSLLLIISCIDPPYPEQLMLQHIPTVVCLVALALLHRFVELSRSSFVCLLAFLLLHLVGARYIYSFVPYDAWALSIFGSSISEIFGWQRNHYDRLVHFCYGLLLVLPAREILRRYSSLTWIMSSYVAVEFVMASSMVYELAEWGIALLLSPDAAEGYNGQQGDMWDAQKDMALASVGAILGILLSRRRVGQPEGADSPSSLASAEQTVL